MFDGLIEIAVALVAGGGIKHLLDYLNKKKKLDNLLKVDNFKRTFDDIHKVYTCLNHLSYHCNAERVVIVKVEDSGGIPSVNSHLRSTVLYEVFEHPLDSIKSHWQNVKVGKEYVEYVREIYSKNFICYSVEELNPSELKDLHYEHNTEIVYSYMLCKSHKYFLYLSVQFSKGDHEMNPVCRNSVRMNKEKLVNIFNGDEYELKAI